MFLWSHLKCMQPQCYFKAYKQDISAVSNSLEEKSWELCKPNELTLLIYNPMSKSYCFLFLTEGLLLQSFMKELVNCHYEHIEGSLQKGAQSAVFFFSIPHIIPVLTSKYSSLEWEAIFLKKIECFTSNLIPRFLQCSDRVTIYASFSVCKI